LNYQSSSCDREKQLGGTIFAVHVVLALAFPSREARRANRVNPKGGAQGCAPFPEAQDAPSGNSRFVRGPNGFIVARAVRAAFFWLLFFAVQRKVTRATRETPFSLKQEQRQHQRHPSSVLPCAMRKGGGNSNSNSNSNGKKQKQDQDGSQLTLE
jgi:hypothetical protein